MKEGLLNNKIVSYLKGIIAIDISLLSKYNQTEIVYKDDLVPINIEIYVS